MANQESISPYINTNTSTMSSSSSQIFATAASFNISQNDAVFYSRETIHLLAKFLSNPEVSDNAIFRSLYAFAPDNLAWLWAFFDWETPIDLDQIESQETYVPWNMMMELNGQGQQGVSLLSKDFTKIINKFISDAPLFQYKYRDNIMIGDVFKFIEHIQKISFLPIAKALFCIYFPRFASYIDNPLKKFNICPKILKTNLSRIKLVDKIVISLIKSRYSNMSEYKQKILTCTQLPSYVKSLLIENNFWSPNSKLLQQFLMSNHVQQQHQQHHASKESSSSSISSLNEQTFQQHNFKKPNDQNNNIFQFNTSLKNTTKEYLDMVRNSNCKINNDLDNSFNNSKLNTQQHYQQQMQQQQPPPPPHISLASAEEFECDDFEDSNEHETDDLNDLNDEQQQRSSEASHAAFNAAAHDEKLNFPIGLVFDNADNLSDTQSATTTTQVAARQENFNYYLNNIQQMNQNELQLLNELTIAATQPRCTINNKTNTNTNRTLEYSNLDIDESLSQTQSPCPMSPAARQASKILQNTPKTPSNISQYLAYQQNSSFSMLQDNKDATVWNNNNNNKSNSKLFMSSTASVTPPSSAASLKQHQSTPLSVITNGLGAFDLDATSHDFNEQIGVGVGSPTTFSSAFNSAFSSSRNNNNSNTSFNLNQLDPLIMNSIASDESWSKYIKNSAFISSPVTRFDRASLHFSNSNQKQNAANMFGNKLNNSSSNKFSFVKSSGNDVASFLNYSDLKNNSNNGLYLQQQQQQPACKSPVQSNVSLFLSQQNQTVNNYFSSANSNNNAAASSMMQVWSGRLPPKIYSENALYSRKVFLGGLPWDVNQQSLLQSLHRYGSVKLEIPGKDAKHPRVSSICKTQERSTPGYVYIIFDHEASVQKMLADCRKEIKNGGEHYYYSIMIPPAAACSSTASNGNMHYQNQFNNSKRSKAKEVEVIPWNQDDTSYVPQNKTSVLPAKIDAKSTIFVGALHGMLNALGLAKIMSEIFGEVIHAGLDTDKYKYPIGSGRVTFRNRSSYLKANKSKFVTIKANLDPNDPSPKFEKTIQIDPYLEDAKCCKCDGKSFHFCRNENCLDYYCPNCWQFRHDTKNNGEHTSLSRQNKQAFC